jgi:rhodanese-related sulfurtransferase
MRRSRGGATRCGKKGLPAQGAPQPSYNRSTPDLRTPALNPFFTDLSVWIAIVAAAVSGGLLLWPTITGARTGGISPAEAVRLMNREKASVIDVSEPGEYAAGHIVGSRNVPMGRLEVAPELPKNKTLPVVLVCASGKRAAAAAKALQAKGYAKAVVLAGGMTAWKAANMPVEVAATPA